METVAMDPRVQHAIDRMEERLHTRLSIGDLAAEVGLSISQLARLFRDAIGTTPHAHLRHLRMTRARILVERTSLSIADVMSQVGMSDPSHFARDFRRAHGFSPRALRQHLRWTVGRASTPRRFRG
jgi:AraC family transcriptional regulator, arabinose operon regulatory protein